MRSDSLNTLDLHTIKTLSSKARGFDSPSTLTFLTPMFACFKGAHIKVAMESENFFSRERIIENDIDGKHVNNAHPTAPLGSSTSVT